jgi:outer membrane cobalamin receptor
MLAVMTGALLAGAPATFAAEAGEGSRLDEVVVTATMNPVAPDQVPQTVYVLDRQDLEEANGILSQALDRLPGVRINGYGSRFMAALPTIRDSQPMEVLLLLDGIRLNSRQSGWFSLSDLPVSPLSLRKVEVLAGSASALYGSDAMGGVINVVTADPLAAPGIDLLLETGSFGSRGAEFAWAGRGGALGVSLDAGRATIQGHRPNSDATQDRFGARLVWPGEGWTADAAISQVDREMGSPGPTAFPSLLARQRDATTVSRASLEREFSDAVTIRVDLFANRFFREYRDPDWDSYSRHLTHASGVALKGVFTGPWGGRWTAGAERLRDELESTNDGDHTAHRSGFFLQDEYTRGPLTLVGTARIDQFSPGGDQFSPRLAGSYRVGDLTLRASAARGYRVPTFDDLYWNDFFARGNPDLKAERSWNWEAGAAGRGPGGLRWDAVLYRRDVDELIVWGDPDGDWVYVPANMATARISGATLAMGVTLPRGEVLDLSYSYLRPEDRDKGEMIPGRVKQSAKASLTFPVASFMASLNLGWTDRYRAPNLPETDYWTSALRIARTLTLAKGASLELAGWIDNLLNDAYQTLPGYPAPTRGVGASAVLSF